MRVQKRIRNLTQPEQEQFEKYLEKKLEAIAPLLESHYPDPDSVHVFAEIQKHEKHTAYDFDCILEMPRKRLVAEEVKHTITESMDFAMQKLEQRLNKHFKKLREPPRRQRDIRTMKGLPAETPVEELFPA